MRSIPSPRRLAALALAGVLCTEIPRANADCIDDAAARHRVNALVLRAIGWQESRLRPEAMARNVNGSIDIGAFQINSIHLPTLASAGIDRTSLIDGCVSAEVAAWHYRRQVELFGDTWQAVGAYHSRTNVLAAQYANRIAAVLVHWQAMPASALPFPTRRQVAPRHDRARPAVSAPPAGNVPAAAASPDLRRFDEIAFAPGAR